MPFIDLNIHAQNFIKISCDELQYQKDDQIQIFQFFIVINLSVKSFHIFQYLCVNISKITIHEKVVF